MEQPAGIVLDHLGQLDPPPTHDLVDLTELRPGPDGPFGELLHLDRVLPGGQLGRIGDERENVLGRPGDVNRGARHDKTLRGVGAPDQAR